MFALDIDQWLLALLHVSIVYTLITVLHIIIPARSVRGYVSDGPAFYRLNGLRVFLIVSGMFILLVQYGVISINQLLELRLKHGLCACALGILFTFILVLPYPKRSSSFWLDIYLGRLKNPQWFSNRVDGKMLLYLIGGTGLELNLILFYFEHRQDDSLTTNVVLYVGLFTFFLTEYFYHEYVHIYTFDFIVEYVGFKLVWGCLLFYPFVYPIGIWCSIVEKKLSFLRFWSSLLIFFLGWILSRGANNQKFLFRTQPKAKFLGFLEAKSINGRLLCSGWWSLSRHINYLGDTLMAVGLSLAIEGGFVPWLYPLYYVALFIGRERTDFEQCRQKYGHHWDEYCRRVPYRIIPLVY